MFGCVSDWRRGPGWQAAHRWPLAEFNELSTSTVQALQARDMNVILMNCLPGIPLTLGCVLMAALLEIWQRRAFVASQKFARKADAGEELPRETPPSRDVF